MKKIADILTKELNGLKDDIIKNMKSNNRVASGKTANSLRVEVKQRGEITTGYLYGSEVLDILEDGRGKTKNASSSATWADELKAWMRTKGISEDAFYPIYKKINREGYKGTPGLISNPIEQFNKNIASAFSEFIVESVRNGISRNR